MIGAAPLDAFKVQGTDFRAARRSNMRRTILLAFILVVVLAAFGYLVGWGVEVLVGLDAHPERTASDVFSQLWTEVSLEGLWAAAVAFVLGGVWVVVSLLMADRAMLWISGARKADGTSADERLLRNVVEEMAIAAGLPVPDAYIIDDDGLNAFATGLMPDRSAVAVTRGLMRKLDRDELQAVVGHEVGHILNGDVRLMVAAGAMVGLVVFLGEILFNARHIAAGIRASKNRNAAPIIVLVMAVWFIGALVAILAAQVLRMAISRQREYLADATAVMLSRNPRAMASALAKISGNPIVTSAGKSTAHLYICNPLSGLFSTHPPIAARIERVLNLR